MLIDSHCHLNRIDLTDFDHNLAQVIAKAREHGVTHMLSVSVELDDWPVLKSIALQFEHVSISAGVHPDSESQMPLHAEDLLVMAEDSSCVALGETGLDFYRQEAPEQQADQKARFRTHIAIARQTHKPLIIHTRHAAAETIQLMHDECARDVSGVMHCFTESWDVAKQAMDLGFYISFSGIVSFKNATALQEVAKKVPLDRLLIETDSPYLAPVPFRGQQNHPALVKYVAEAMAQLRGESYQSITKATAENFYRCFPGAAS